MSSVRRPRISKPRLPKIKKPNLAKSKRFGKKRPTLSIKGSRRKTTTNPIRKKKHHTKTTATSSKSLKYTKSQLDKIKKEIQDKRLKQSKTINQVKDDIKKIRENNISMSGLEQISSISIKKMQEKRTKSVLHLTSTVNELNVLMKDIANLETKYKKAL